MANDQEQVSTQQKVRRNEKKRRRKKSNKPETTKKQQNPKSNQKKSQANHQPIIIPKIQEPVPLCSLCGKPIDSIAQSIGGPEPETFAHFDCVLRKIEDEEHVVPPQKVSYIGRGTFAIIDMHDDATFTIVKRIPYENPETFSFMKKYVESRKR